MAEFVALVCDCSLKTWGVLEIVWLVLRDKVLGQLQYTMDHGSTN